MGRIEAVGQTKYILIRANFLLWKFSVSRLGPGYDHDINSLLEIVTSRISRFHQNRDPFIVPSFLLRAKITNPLSSTLHFFFPHNPRLFPP